MALKVTGLSIWIHVQVEPSSRYLLINYTPIALEGDASGHRRQLTDYNAQFQKDLEDLPASLRACNKTPDRHEPLQFESSAELLNTGPTDRY
jgi:hypothetical protein